MARVASSAQGEPRAGEAKGKNSSFYTRVSEAMSTVLVTATREEAVSIVRQRAEQGQVHHVIVTHAGGDLAGILCLCDMECDDRLGAWLGLGRIDCANDRDEPLVAVASQGATLGVPSSGRWTMVRRLPSLGKRSVLPESRQHLGCGSVKPSESRPFSLPARRAGELLETALPSFIELDQELTNTPESGRPRVTHVAKASSNARGALFTFVIHTARARRRRASAGDRHLHQQALPQAPQRIAPAQ
jgi:hypothetical protein